ncbi:MAG: DUF2238 domain-containing protein [Planctomycetota bacterium]
MSLRIALAATGVTLFALSAIGPWFPQDFLVEHILTVIVVAGLVVADRRRPLTDASLLLLFAFLLLHLLGAHYTYSEVPYDAWAEAVAGTSVSETFGWSRNHYDRFVHLAFGVLLVYPMRELLARAVPEMHVRDGRLLLAALLVLGCLSTLYELMEWVFTLIMTQDAAATYNGEQGDLRDAHKDMALALAGSLVSAGVLHFHDRRARRRGECRPRN